ncbi:MAG: ABC transporter permease [Gemmatimonadota bacterium]|nr:ABC transporter permease [Gemmatimonadota bacterium]
MDRLLPDLSHSVRRLVRAPGFATVALVTLALGIGANTAIFSILKSVVLRPLPYGDPARVVMIWRPGDKGEMTWLSAPEVKDYARESSFEDLAAYLRTAATLGGGGEPERVVAAYATPNLFRTLRVRPAHGRAFLPEDGSVDPTIVMLGHGVWERRYGGDPRIVGRSIIVGDRARTVVGVLPPSFRVPLDFAEQRPIELWMPTTLDDPDYAGFGNRSFIGIGRLARGVDPARATVAMQALEDRWFREGLVRNRVRSRDAVPAQELVLGDVRYALFVLLGAVGVILLIACANVANLMLARADARHREIAIRTALGASRARLVRQLLTESVLLSLIGGALGVALAYAGTKLLVALHPPGVPRVAEVGLDAGVLGITLLLAVTTGVLFGLAPALELSRPQISRALKEGGRTGTVGRRQQRFRDSLAVAQVAFSVMLLIGALLLVRSFAALQRVDLGFDTRDALTFRVGVPVSRYPESGDVIAFYRTLQERLGQLPNVRAVGATRLLPLTGTIGDWSITIEGRDRAPGDNPNGDWQVVTAGYFESMGMKLVRGRFITAGDHENAPLATVINETMADRYWPGVDPIGKRFHIGDRDQPWITVVGVTRQVRHNAVVETPRAEMYVPHAQWDAAGASTPRSMSFVVRTTRIRGSANDPRALVDHVRRAVHALDPTLPISDIQTLEQVAADSLARPRFTTTLLGVFAALALTLATIGIYGVVSLLVTRRRQEIGIRMALGARRGSILQMVLRRGMALAAVGLVIGLTGALWLTGALTSLLYGVTRFDPLTFAAAPALLAGVALLACMVPAARAAAVNPVIALRDE